MPYFKSKLLPWASDSNTLLAKYDNFEDAFISSPLNYEVVQRPCHIFDAQNKLAKVPDVKVNVRADSGQVLGIASNKYKIVQNRPAFERSIEALRKQMPMTFTSCGVIRGGEAAHMTLTSEEIIVNGEVYRFAFIFSNSFNNRSSVKVVFAGYRQVCLNGMHVDIKGAKKFFNFKHTGDMDLKLDEAVWAIETYNDYLYAFRRVMRHLESVNVELPWFLDQMFPFVENATPNMAMVTEVMRNELTTAYNVDNLQNMGHNAYRIIQAVSDVDTHFSIKNTKNIVENKIQNIAIQSRPTLLQKSYDVLARL